jgi:hypothetical protein
MEQLSLRPTVIAGQRGEDDWQVIWDGIPIGRILKAPGVPNGQPNWSWGVILPNRPQQPWHRGMESGLEECKRRFRVTWTAILAELTAADIEAARTTAADNRKRWKD